jgi:hypothetical protein
MSSIWTHNGPSFVNATENSSIHGPILLAAQCAILLRANLCCAIRHLLREMLHVTQDRFAQQASHPWRSELMKNTLRRFSPLWPASPGDKPPGYCQGTPAQVAAAHAPVPAQKPGPGRSSYERGVGRALRYLPPGGAGRVRPHTGGIGGSGASGYDFPDGVAIEHYLRRPSEARKPVSYNREFLNSYRPNVQFYLSPEERAQLSETGARRVAAEAAGTYTKQILGRLLIDLSWNSSRLEGNT